jgi:hypothetical protein
MRRVILHEKERAFSICKAREHKHTIAPRKQDFQGECATAGNPQAEGQAPG